MAAHHGKWGHRHLRQAAVAGAAAIGLLAVSSLAIANPATSATPTVVTTPSTPAPAPLPPATAATAGGWLALETGLANRVTYDSNRDLTPEAVQPLSGDPATCLLWTDQSLLKITGFVGAGTTNLASFKNGKIGVADKSVGASCNQVNAPAERLDLELANPALSMSSALLDLEIRSSARILATATYKGVVTGYFQLQSGTSIGTATPLPGGATPTATFTCASRYDDDREHGLDDDCRWPISSPSWSGDDGVYFDKLSLQAVNGKFSLDDGSDGDVPNGPPAGFPRRASLFELSASLISCNQSTVTLPAELTAPAVTVHRLSNADATACAPIPISVSHDALTATILKPLAQQTTAQFVIDVTWSLPITPGSPANQSATTIDYQAGNPPVPLPWCPDPQFTGTATTLIGIGNPLGQPDQDPTLRGTQFSCVGTSSAVTITGNTTSVTVSEQIYLEGDAILSRRGG